MLLRPFFLKSGLCTRKNKNLSKQDKFAMLKTLLNPGEAYLMTETFRSATKKSYFDEEIAKPKKRSAGILPASGVWTF